MKLKSKIKNKSNPLEANKLRIRHVDVEDEAEAAEELLRKAGRIKR